MDARAPRVAAAAEQGGRAWRWEGFMRWGDHQGPTEISLCMTRYLMIGVSDNEFFALIIVHALRYILIYLLI